MRQRKQRQTPQDIGEGLRRSSTVDIAGDPCSLVGANIRALGQRVKRCPPGCGIDSNNGSEFINHHLYRSCQQQEIQFTRGRPYKKADNVCLRISVMLNTQIARS